MARIFKKEQERQMKKKQLLYIQTVHSELESIKLATQHPSLTPSKKTDEINL